MPVQDARSSALYLDLLKRCLTRTLFPDGSWDWDLVHTRAFDPAVREDGRDWPIDAETMVGLRRLDNLQDCIVEVLKEGVPGDLVETGVWRGGCAILMRAVLEAYGDETRSVWLADSFQGLPPPSPGEYPQDAGDPAEREPAFEDVVEVLLGGEPQGVGCRVGRHGRASRECAVNGAPGRPTARP